MNLIKNAIQSFNRVTLNNLGKVKLMDRTDFKFCIQRQLLPGILESLKDNYSILEIQGETILPYDNTYFDTLDDQMYLHHQNGKMNRYKIRIRQYLQSEENFLEIKFKTNKGRTIKERIERQGFNTTFENSELDFLQNSSPYSGSQLYPKIKSSFNRITLINNQFTERITIDTFPGFKNQEKEITLENLVIIEVKQCKSNKPAVIIQVLKDHKIRKQSFSKYCIGRSLLEEKIKKNNFKPLLLILEKEYHN
jgi:hypothetical protein